MISNSHRLDSLAAVDGWQIITHLSPRLQAALGPRLCQQARANLAHVEICTFRYRTGGQLVGGFMVRPRLHLGKLPCVIYNRGGTENYGLVGTGLLATHLATIARQGYVVIGSQYPGNKLSQGHDERGGTSDVQAVLDIYNQIIQPCLWMDERRVAMYGFSRGGMMTYLALKQVDWLRAAIVLAGSANLMAEAARRPKLRPVFRQAFGMSQAALLARSAVCWPQAINPAVPILMLHAAGDQHVDVADAKELYGLLTPYNSAVRLQVFASRDHSLNDQAKRRDAMIIAWLKQYL